MKYRVLTFSTVAWKRSSVGLLDQQEMWHEVIASYHPLQHFNNLLLFVFFKELTIFNNPCLTSNFLKELTLSKTKSTIAFSVKSRVSKQLSPEMLIKCFHYWIWNLITYRKIIAHFSQCTLLISLLIDQRFIPISSGGQKVYLNEMD